MQRGTSKWWFYLYSLCSQFVNETDEACNFTELVTALEKFLETTSLGEFSSKLDLLLIFHCHYINQLPNSRISE